MLDLTALQGQVEQMADYLAMKRIAESLSLLAVPMAVVSDEGVYKFQIGDRLFTPAELNAYLNPVKAGE